MHFTVIWTFESVMIYPLDGTNLMMVILLQKKIIAVKVLIFLIMHLEQHMLKLNLKNNYDKSFKDFIIIIILKSR